MDYLFRIRYTSRISDILSTTKRTINSFKTAIYNDTKVNTQIEYSIIPEIGDEKPMSILRPYIYTTDTIAS